jgi:hypothetical protein
MKKSNYCSCGLLIIALGFTFFSGCETTGTGASSSTSPASTVASAQSGRLVIRRVANIGTSLVLNVSVDGRHVASVSEGQTYRGSLSAGPHVVSVILDPNAMNLAPTQKRITVQKGQTYTFTATWDGNVLALL